MSATMNFIDETPEVAPQRRSLTRSLWFPWLVVLAIFVGLLIIFSPVVFIRSGHQGVATFFGDTQGEVLSEGVHFKYPLLRVHQFDTRTQTRDLSAGVVTEDMQLVTLAFTVSYRLDADALRDLYEDYGMEPEAKLLDPAAKEAVNLAATKFTADELMTDRDVLKEAMMTELETQLVESGLTVGRIAITELTFSKSLEQAFEGKVIAEQEAAAAKLRAETAEWDKQSEAGISAAEAERIRVIGEALRGNEAYIQYRIMKKWDGTTPLYLAPISTTQTDSK